MMYKCPTRIGLPQLPHTCINLTPTTGSDPIFNFCNECFEKSKIQYEALQKMTSLPFAGVKYAEAMAALYQKHLQ